MFLRCPPIREDMDQLSTGLFFQCPFGHIQDFTIYRYLLQNLLSFLTNLRTWSGFRFQVPVLLSTNSNLGQAWRVCWRRVLGNIGYSNFHHISVYLPRFLSPPLHKYPRKAVSAWFSFENFVIACFSEVLIHQIRQPWVSIGLTTAVFNQYEALGFNLYVFPIVL